MLRRALAIPLRRAAQLREPLLLQGPRGAGKTTLARAEFPEYAYFSMEDPDARRAVAWLRGPAILDDAHRAPEVLEYVTGKPVIAVSSQRLRTALPTLTLYPPTRAELEQRPPLTLEPPERFAAAQPFPDGRSYLHHDVRDLVHVRELERFETFAREVRERSGQVLDQQSIARACGLSHRTVVRWMNALDQCFRLLLLAPDEHTFGRRVIRAPKMHWLGSDSFESQVVWEMYRNALHSGNEPAMRYWRDSNGLEIPLIMDGTPVMIAREPNPVDEARLRRWQALAGTASGAIVGERAGPSRRGAFRYSARQL
ncbi:MAG: ATP-binding protein [Acidobacteria bacterium]|nr:ATP-binding protein [Acidobacteriota bacterium]